MVTKTEPIGVRVRMYQVGFGDCFLVSFEYPAPVGGRTARHILFDLGSTRAAHDSTFTMETVAKLIKEHTQGQLDVLVITHRHKDHIGGFGIAGCGSIIEELKPKLVLRPWTEDPELGADARGPALAGTSRGFVAALAEAQTAVGDLNFEKGRRGALGALAAATDDQLPNQDALDRLVRMSEDGRGRYLHAGKTIGVGTVIPGLKVTVLGPPTVEQHPEVAGQASSDPEYWMFRLGRSLQAAATITAPAAARRTGTATIPPGPVRWLVEHLKPQRTSSVARLVTSLDDAMNNTSLILLLEVGELSLLFPGDAQIENWNYTLGRLATNPELTEKLTNIDLYKVGHHGSRNATPRSLHHLWTQRPGKPQLTALMSTRSGVHGKKKETAVPRETLVEALKQVATLYSTDELPTTQPYVEVFAPTTGGPFTLVKPGK